MKNIGAVPPNATKTVTAAWEAYTNLFDAEEACRDRRSDEVEAGAARIAEAKSEASRQMAVGVKIKKPVSAVKAEHEAALAEIDEELAQFKTAAKLAHSNVLDALEESAETMLAAMADAEAEAVEALDAGLALVREALTDIERVRSFQDTLLDLAEARRTGHVNFAVQPLRVDAREARRFDTFTNPLTVLDVVALARTRPEPPKPRSLRAAKESSRSLS